MKTIKIFEIRDRSTFIPAIAFKIEGKNDQERYLLSRAGFGRLPANQSDYVFLCRASNPSQCEHDEYAWNNRTMSNAHKIIMENWETLRGGEVVDVEFYLGETNTPKESEREDTHD